MSTLTVTIAGTSYNIQIDSLSFPDRIEERSKCSMVIQTDLSTTFSFGQRVTVDDSVLGRLFSGIVNTDSYERIHPNDRLEHSIDCIDSTFDVDRLTSDEEYTEQYAGVIVADQHQKHLAAEGITAAYALDIDSEQADFAAGTLSGTIATTTDDGTGCLELAKAGTDVSFSLTSQADFAAGTGSGLSPVATGGLSFTPTQAIKFAATQAVAGLANAFLFYKIWAGSYTIASGDRIQYDMWIDGNSPAKRCAVDLAISTGDYLTSSQSIVGVDAQGIGPSHNNDYAGVAVNQWYSRSFPLDGGTWVGKTISYSSIIFGGDDPGNYVSYFRNIKIVNGATTKLTIFGPNDTAMNVVQQIQTSGYTNAVCAVATTYERHGTWLSASIPLSSAALARSSFLTYQASLPTSDLTAIITASIDASTFQTCANNASIPGIISGMNLSGLSLKFAVTFDNKGADPTITPLISRVAGNVMSAYTCSKSDSVTTVNATTGFAGGTLTNLINNASNALQLNGYARNWDNGDKSNQTLFGASSPAQSIQRGQFVLSCGSGGNDTRSRLDFVGNTWVDFTAEFDLTLGPASTQCGFVYRTSGWQNATNTFGYCIIVQLSGMVFGRGTNTSSGGGAFTTIDPGPALTLTAGDTHRLKIVVSGTLHQFYLDDVLYISKTDSAISTAGYVGLRFQNSTGSTQTGTFDNFGIVAALSGTYVSPAIDPHSLNIISGSQLALQIDPGVSSATSSVSADISLDNGSTWTPCTNKASADALGLLYFQCSPVPGLLPGAVVSAITQIKVRLTITATTAATGATMPAITAMTLWLIGSYSSSGTRVSLLSLTSAGRVGSTLVATNANTPGGTALFLATSPDNATWTNVSSGSPIPGIVQQIDPVVDTFNVDTSGFYINTSVTGGSAATVAYDTANSRVTLSGGSSGLFRYDALYVADGYTEVDLDQAANSGLAARITGPNTMYALYIWDASASGTPNTFKLDSIVSGVHTTLLTGSISFVRGTYHKFRLSAIGTTISATMDGTSLGSVTNSAVVGLGKFALLTNTLLRCYNLRMQALGDDLTGRNVYVRSTLVSVDPTATPQQLSLTVAALSPDIGIGALIPSENCNNDHINKVIGDVTGPSDYYWFVRPDKSLVARGRQADPAPWILTGDDMMIVSGPTVESNGDNYRNRQIVTGVTDTIGFTDRKTGDGSTRTWTLKYKLASAPTVLLNGQPATVALKGTTGSDFYYEVGSDSLTQDDSGTILEPNVDFLDVTGEGQTTTTVVRDNTGKFPGTISQADFKAITGGTGIVTDVQDGSGMSVDDAELWADGLLQTFGRIGRSVTFQSKRSGLKSGQYLTAINPKILLNDASLLITSVALSYYAGKTLFFDVEAVEGPNNGSWAKIIGNVLGLTKAPRGITTKRRKKRVATTVLYSASASYTTSGNSADLPVDDLLELAVDVNVTAKSGTSPTLVLSVERKGADGQYYQIWASSSITNTGKQSTSIGTGMTTAQSFGSLCRLVWTIGGTTPSWTFTASIIGK